MKTVPLSSHCQNSFFPIAWTPIHARCYYYHKKFLCIITYFLIDLEYNLMHIMTWFGNTFFFSLLNLLLL